MNRHDVVIKNSQQGVVLLEALIAVLIFSMGILALVGLQTAMVKNTSDAKFRADASFIAQQSLGALWVNPAASIVNGTTTSNIPNLLPNGVRTVTIANGGQVSVVITWQTPGQDAHNFTTYARIAGG